jgi:hypothetical protein
MPIKREDLIEENKSKSIEIVEAQGKIQKNDILLHIMDRLGVNILEDRFLKVYNVLSSLQENFYIDNIVDAITQILDQTDEA